MTQKKIKTKNGSLGNEVKEKEKSDQSHMMDFILFLLFHKTLSQ